MGARHALLNIGNDSLGCHNTATNVGNRDICVYHEFGLDPMEAWTRQRWPELREQQTGH